MAGPSPVSAPDAIPPGSKARAGEAQNLAELLALVGGNGNGGQANTLKALANLLNPPATKKKSQAELLSELLNRDPDRDDLTALFAADSPIITPKTIDCRTNGATQDECDKLKQCYWYEAGTTPQCIHQSERLYNALAAKLAKRGKKDFAIQVFYKSRPSKINLPNGLFGPHIVGAFQHLRGIYPYHKPYGYNAYDGGYGQQSYGGYGQQSYGGYSDPYGPPKPYGGGDPYYPPKPYGGGDPYYPPKPYGGGDPYEPTEEYKDEEYGGETYTEAPYTEDYGGYSDPYGPPKPYGGGDPYGPPPPPPYGGYSDPYGPPKPYGGGDPYGPPPPPPYGGYGEPYPPKPYTPAPPMYGGYGEPYPPKPYPGPPPPYGYQGGYKGPTHDHHQTHSEGHE